MADLYDTFDPPEAEPQWGGSSNPYNVPSSTAAAANPLMQRPPSKWGAAPGSQWGGVPGSRGAGALTGAARPMTSNRGANFNATGGNVFDPTGHGRMMMDAAPPLQQRGENSPEEQCMEMERQVNTLIEESAMLATQGDHGGALEKAKEAGKKERALVKQREQLGLGEQTNMDLTYAVHFNLAVQYHRHQLYTEALNTYSLIVRNFQFPQSSRLRVNMGNIYAEQKKFLLAVKMYRTALQEIPTAGKEIRMKITRNIGNAFAKMGQYKDAALSYESVMDGSPDIISGFNLLLCYYALGDTEKLKRAFGRMLELQGPLLDGEDDDKDVLVDDALYKELKERRKQYVRFVITGARMIAPMIDKDWRVGYDYVIEQLRRHEVQDATANLAAELEMCKALNYLKHKKYKEAIDGLRAFERKDKVLRARAATNLAYLYYLEGDLDSGEKYADMSIEFDRYNAKALVNKGNFLYAKGELDRAKGLYTEALAIEADNVEAIYNLGLTTKALGLHDEAMRMFKRLQSFVECVEVIYQIADLHEIMGDPAATDWFARLIGRVPTDPGVLARLGQRFAREGDESQAFHYFLEAYRYYQVNMDVISWLGAYFVHNEVYDKALQFFERASQIQPQEVKWQLMAASCYRRRGETAHAKRIYEEVHRRHPDDLESLRFLVILCKDAGLIEEANNWLKEKKRVEQRIADRGGSSDLHSAHHDGGEEAGSDDEEGGGASLERRRGTNPAGESANDTHQKGGTAKKAKKTKPQSDDDDDDGLMLPGA